MVWEVDANGFFLHVSPVCADIIGYTSDELIGKMHFLHPEDSRDQFLIAPGCLSRNNSFMGWIHCKPKMVQPYMYQPMVSQV